LPAGPLRTFDSAQLFDGQKEVQIRHKGALYRLKITRQGKLILNK
jgi:hemin uptake protein HemP